MAHARAQVEQYEPPRIEDRTEIGLPLIGNVSIPATHSAAFRPQSVETYEPPRIEERTAVDLPMVQAASADTKSAVFRSV